MVLTIVCIFGIIYIVSFVVIPQLGAAATKLSNDIQTSVPRFQRWIENLLERYPQVLEVAQPYLNTTPDWDSMIKTVTDFLVNGGTNLVGNTLSAATQMAGTIVSSVSSLLISFIFACYILIQKEKLSRQCKKSLCAFLPERISAKILQVCSLSHRIFSRFIAGQCLEACILGIMFFIVLSLGKFPYALLISVMIAFLALIPIFGAFIGCVLGAFLILTESPIRALAFIVVFLIVQQIEGNLIYPKVVGGSIGLPSIWVLAAVSLGGSLFGIAGMLIFIPLTSVVYTLFKEEVNRRLDPGVYRRIISSIQREEKADGSLESEKKPEKESPKQDSKNKQRKEDNQ
ncbi:MAG TPA: AI-2E family transporter [Candidatus Pelethocola excrementipullorum]|nr:AI-2E family transporter [Candidatus Pelethocola excrementipullorum]